jgi:hypothetical protein
VWNLAQVQSALICLIVCLVFGLRASAQVNTGTLSGQVEDASASVVPGATVAVAEQTTGYSRQAQTDGNGTYIFPELPIGQYTVTVEANGFETVKGTAIINVGVRSRSDFHLRVGSTGQTIEVTASGAALSRDDASISTLVTKDTISDTPLYLRNWDDLLRTVPGVQINRYTNQSGATSSGRTGSFNVNGVHSLQNNFILDGIDNNTFSENVQELSTESAHPSVDVISEFNVITNPYSSEYGRAPGAVVSVNTRSGANRFHGTAYEFVRNQYFDAFDYFTKRTTTTKAQDNQNQFGASMGGPIVRNKAFFFFNYEGTRIKQGLSRISTVPLDNERIGDFSSAAAAANGLTPYPTIYNLSLCPTPINISTCAPPPLLNNSFQSDPSAHIDAAVAKLMALFPEPNYKPNSANFPDVNNYSRTGASTDFNDSYDARVDWTPTSVDTIFGRFNYFNRTRDIPGYLGGIADGTSTSAWGNQSLKGASLVLGWTRVISPRIVNDFRFGWVRDYSFAEQQPFSLDQLAGDFLPGVPNNPAIGGGVPLTTFSSHGFLGSPDFLPKQQVPMVYQYNDSLSWTLGKHNLKMGATVYLPMRNLFQDEPGMRGDLTFNGVFSGLGTATVKGTTNARDYADGLFGATQYTQLTNVYFVDQRLWLASGFFEDDWKATPRLTFNLGLRYDFATPALEGRNRIANFDPAGSGSLTFAKSGSISDRSLIDTNLTNFGPRFGVSYAVNDATVIRAGYGVYYSVFERFGSEDQLALNPPFLINKTQASTTQSVITPEVGFPSNFLDPSTIDFNNLQAFHIRALNPAAKEPMVQQWSGGFQRQIGPHWLAEADYVGTKSTHLDVIYDYNQPIISGGVSTGVQPYPNFGQVEYTTPFGYGNYNGLQASLVRQMVNGLSVRAAYTYSRSLDNTPEELESNSGDPPNGRNYAGWYGPSDFDVPHRVSVSYVYEPPFGHGKAMFNSGPLAWILGNWQTSGVYTFYSGHPFQAKWGSESSQLDPYGYATAVPNTVAPVHYVHSASCWFYISKNGACSAPSASITDPFADPGKFVVGDTGRNTLRGPNTNVFDAALVKHIPIHESWELEARWEVFNVANHALFGQPSGDASSGGVASITNLSGDPRVMQFAIRVNW